MTEEGWGLGAARSEGRFRGSSGNVNRLVKIFGQRARS